MEIRKMRSSFFPILFLFAVAFSIMPPSVIAQQPAATAVYGGGGGSPFSDIEISAEARILEVNVFSGDYVDAVQITYILPDGRTFSSARHGGGRGSPHVFRLDSDEYITGLSGRYGNYIDSLCIRTNKRSSPVFGGRGGKRDYGIELPSGNYAVGFVGRAGDYLDAIGLTYLPLALRDLQLTSTAGGRGGSEFSDREIPAGARITEIRVRSGNYIDSLQMVYVLRDGRSFNGPLHGGSGGRSNVFRLEPDEYLIGISGRYGSYIDSLTFHTNKRTSATFGGRGGNRDFRIFVPSGNQAIGLAGRASRYLDAIGLRYDSIASQPNDSRRRRRRR